MELLTPVLAVLLIFGTPIVLIIGIVWIIVSRTRQRTELRKEIAKTTSDAEMARTLVGDTERKGQDYGVLHTASALLGIGIGGAVGAVLHLEADDIYLWLLLAAGAGVALLTSFIVAYHFLAPRNAPPAPPYASPAAPPYTPPAPSHDTPSAAPHDNMAER